MAEQMDHSRHFIVPMKQPLIGIFRKENDHEVVQYFTEESHLDKKARSRSIQEVLKLAGSWSDLDWDEMEQELYRIRHESQPTPPIDL